MCRANQTNINLFSIENCFSAFYTFLLLPISPFPSLFTQRFPILFLSSEESQEVKKKYRNICENVVSRKILSLANINLYVLIVCLNKSRAHLHKASLSLVRLLPRLLSPYKAHFAIENLRSCNKSCMICVPTIPRNYRGKFSRDTKCVSCVASRQPKYVHSTTVQTLRCFCC